MSAPQRPLEAPNFQQMPQMSNIIVQQPGSCVMHPNVVTVPSRARLRSASVPPPLPPRGQATGYGLPPVTNMYADPSQMYNPYSVYGGNTRYANHYATGYRSVSYGYPGYSRFGEPDLDSRFIQMAEESTRPAFQSIESFVRTFGSVSVMLESTLGAMYASFRAVVGVAENFQRLRHMLVQFAQYMSAFALLKMIYHFYRRMLYMLGLIKNCPTREDIWNAAEQSVGAAAGTALSTASPRRSSWPIVTFFGLLFGGPYLMYKLFGPSATRPPGDAGAAGAAGGAGGADGAAAGVKWDPRVHKCDHVLAVHSFAASNERELSFAAGEVMRVPKRKHLPPNSSWCIALNNSNHFGYIPLNRVRYVQKAVKTMASGDAVQKSSLKQVNVTVPDVIIEEEQIPVIPQEPIRVDLTPPRVQQVPPLIQVENVPPTA